MSTFASQRLPRLRGGLYYRLLKRHGVSPFVVIVLLGWSTMLVPVLGFKGARFGALAFITMYVTWIATLVVRFLRHRESDPNLEVAAYWTSVICVAYLVTSLGSANAATALVAVAALTIATILCKRFPVIAIAFLALLTGFNGTAQVYGHIGVGPFVHLTLAGLWLSLIWRFATHKRERALWTWPAMLLVGIYLAINLIELTTAESLYIGLRTLSLGPWYMLAFVVIAYTGLPERSHLNLARLFVAIAVAVAGYAFLRYFIGASAKEQVYARSVGGNFNTVDGDTNTLSLFGSFGGRHDLAVWVTCAAPMLAGCALGWKDRWRWLAVLGLGLCVFDLIETRARDAIPGSIAGLLLTLGLFAFTPAFGGRRLGIAVVSLFTVAAVGATLFLALGVNSKGHYDGLLHPGNDNSFTERTYKWGAAIRDINKHPAGYGLGSAGFQHAKFGRFILTSNYTIENSYLVIAYQEGFIVMALFILTLIAILISLCYRTITTKSEARATLAIGPAGALMSLSVVMITGAYLEGFGALWTWLLLGLGVAQFTFRDAAPQDDEPVDATDAPAANSLPRVAVPA